MLYGTSRRQKRREAAARRRRSKVCTSGGRGRGHLARVARLSKFVVVVVVVVVVWCTKLNVLSKDIMIWVFQCRGRNPLHSSYLRSLSVSSSLSSRDKKTLCRLWVSLMSSSSSSEPPKKVDDSRRRPSSSSSSVGDAFGRIWECYCAFLSFFLSLSLSFAYSPM